MLSFLNRRWFLLALLAVLAVGFPLAETLKPWADQMPRRLIVAGVLFLMALPLEIRAMWRAVRQPRPTLLAVAINFGLLPPLAFVAAPLLQDELAKGLIVVAAIPCTLASAAVWTRRAGGNDAVAVLVTMTTNLACFLVTPAWLMLLTRTAAPIPFYDMVSRLVMLVVLPIVAAQLLRLYRPLAWWATAQKIPLGVLAQGGILAMITLGVVGSGVELARSEQSLGVADWAWMLLVVTVLHVVALALGHLLAPLLGIDRPDRIAVGFAGSQKTLMVGLDLGLRYFGSLVILPMVAYHVSQLLVDTLVADRLRERQPPPDESS